MYVCEQMYQFSMYVKAQNHAHHLFDIFGVAFILYGNEKVK